VKRSLVFLLFLTACVQPVESPLVGDVHEHADFKVYLNGEAYDFSQEKYMSTEEAPLSPFTHVHDGDGEVIHKHMSGITLGTFFESLGMNWTSDCFILDTGTSYCEDATHSLRFFVNGEENEQFENYEFHDLDRILITYGTADEAELQRELASVTDRACIYSETCPERGAPPDESSCTGSSTDCIAPVGAHE
jgi:hypothetical protein